MQNLHHANYHSPVGEMILLANEKALAGLYFAGQKYFSMPENSGFAPELPIFQKTSEWLEEYFSGKAKVMPDIPLAPEGSEFRQHIWRLLRTIPHGFCVTYGELAKKAAAATGKSRISSQAIGGAVAHNPLSIIVPCHRVVGRNGELTGYAAGISIKRHLLALENCQVDMNNRIPIHEKSLPSFMRSQ